MNCTELNWTERLAKVWNLGNAKLQTLPGGGDSAYERGGDARRKFGIKPLEETDPGVAQAFFYP